MVYIVVRGPVRVYERLEEALRDASPGDVVLVVEGSFAVVQTSEGITGPMGTTVSKSTSLSEDATPRVAAVFDQMFRGFAEIVGREVPGVDLHEILGRGIDEPVRVGRLTKWPASDDFDVLKVVEGLAGKYDYVVFFTGDKRLARQAEALGMTNLRVEYMPPNEFPGKESLAKAMIRILKKISGGS